MAQARKRQTVQDILESQRVQRQRMSEQLAGMSARDAENPNVNYALSKFGSGFGSALADSIFGESDELKQARVNDAATENAINTERRQNYILKNSFDSLGMFSQENADEAGRIFDEVVNPQQKSLTTEPGTFNPQEDVVVSRVDAGNESGITSHVNSEVDTQAQFANANATEAALKERNDWLSSTNQSDPFRQTSIYGTPEERDNQLWEMYRNSLNGNKKISTGGSQSTASGTLYTVRGK